MHEMKEAKRQTTSNKREKPIKILLQVARIRKELVSWSKSMFLTPREIFVTRGFQI